MEYNKFKPNWDRYSGVTYEKLQYLFNYDWESNNCVKLWSLCCVDKQQLEAIFILNLQQIKSFQ